MAPQRAGGGQRFRWSRRLLVVVAGFCISACSTAPRPSRPIVTMDARGAEPAGTAEKTHGASSQADPRGTWKSDPPARQRDPARGDDARVTDEPIASGMADGGFYKDDGPGDRAPEELDRVPEPVPRLERLHARANRPYQIEGQLYIPLRELEPYQAEGLASWYGRRYHGRQTANGEIYDMYALSAAHPLLPLPSFARVTHLEAAGPSWCGSMIGAHLSAVGRLTSPLRPHTGSGSVPLDRRGYGWICCCRAGISEPVCASPWPATSCRCLKACLSAPACTRH